MRFEKIKCWFIATSVFDLDSLGETAPTLELLKKSILKNAYRAYCINDRDDIEQADWYRDYQLGETPRFYIDGSGVYKLANIDLTENEFYFEKDNLPAGYRPWIFYSWQSDYNPSRGHLLTAIQETINEVNENRSPKAPLELVQSIRDEDGSSDITDAIKQNIDRCLVAVFDITNVSTVGAEPSDEGEDVEPPKCYPNANVVFELSYALLRKRKDQVVLVRRKRDDLPKDEVPFDFRQLRHAAYASAGEAKSTLMDVIPSTLERMNFIA